MATNNAINLNKPISSFQSVNNANQSNVTGDGTAYAVTFVNEVYDNTNNFDAVSTFSAPRTGLYMLFCDFWVSYAEASSKDCNFYIIADGITYYLNKLDLSAGLSAGGLHYVSSYSILVPMTAASSAIVYIKITGGTKTAEIIGATAASFRTPVFSGTFLTGLI